MFEAIIELTKNLLMFCAGVGFIAGSLTVLNDLSWGCYEELPPALAIFICLAFAAIGVIFIAGAFK